MYLTVKDILDIISIISIIFVLFGGYFLTRGFWKSKKEAQEIGVSRVSGSTEEENLDLPAVKNILDFSRDAKIGFTLIVGGSIAQIILIILERLFD